MNADETLRQLLHERSGEVVILCGAGASHEPPTCLPTASTLMNAYLQNLIEIIENIHGIPIRKYISGRLELVSTRVQFEVFFSHVSKYVDPELDFVRQTLDITDHNWLHRWLAYFIERGATIWTTNFDTGIENAFKDIYGRSPAVAVDWSNDAMISLPNGGIRKLHGSLDSAEKGDLAARVEDLARHAWLLSRSDQLIQVRERELAHKHLLVIGYSGSDTLDITPLIERIPLASLIWLDHSDLPDHFEISCGVTAVSVKATAPTQTWTICANTLAVLGPLCALAPTLKKERRASPSPQEVAYTLISSHQGVTDLLCLLSEIIYGASIEHQLDRFWHEYMLGDKPIAFGRLFLARCYQRKEQYIRSVAAYLEYEQYDDLPHFTRAQIKVLHLQNLVWIGWSGTAQVFANEIIDEVSGTPHESHFRHIVEESLSPGNTLLYSLREFCDQAKRLLSSGQYSSFCIYCYNKCGAVLRSLWAAPEQAQLSADDIHLVVDMTEKCIRLFNLNDIVSHFDGALTYARHKGVLVGDAKFDIEKFVESGVVMDEDNFVKANIFFNIACEIYPDIDLEQILCLCPANRPCNSQTERVRAEGALTGLLIKISEAKTSEGGREIMTVLERYGQNLREKGRSLGFAFALLAWCFDKGDPMETEAETMKLLGELETKIDQRWKTHTSIMEQVLAPLPGNIRANVLLRHVRSLPHYQYMGMLDGVENLKLKGDIRGALLILEYLPRDLVYVLEEYADCYASAGGYAEALTYAQWALRLDDKSYTAWYIVGHILHNSSVPELIPVGRQALLLSLNIEGYNSEIVKEIICACAKMEDPEALSMACKLYVVDDADELFIRTISELIELSSSAEVITVLKMFYRDLFFSGASVEPRSYRHILDLRAQLGIV
jgi:tetratricopeptide (TPR) repeat protein